MLNDMSKALKPSFCLTELVVLGWKIRKKRMMSTCEKVFACAVIHFPFARIFFFYCPYAHVAGVEPFAFFLVPEMDLSC